MNYEQADEVTSDVETFILDQEDFIALINGEVVTREIASGDVKIILKLPSKKALV